MTRLAMRGQGRIAAKPVMEVPEWEPVIPVDAPSLLLNADFPFPRIETELEQLPHDVGTRRAFGFGNTVEHIDQLLRKPQSHDRIGSGGRSTGRSRFRKDDGQLAHEYVIQKIRSAGEPGRSLLLSRTGFLVIAPDSLKRAGRKPDCVGKNQPCVVRQQPRCDRFGQLSGHEFRAVVLTSWRCATPDTVFADLKVPLAVPVMNIVAKEDEWLVNNRGITCAQLLKTHPSSWC